MDKRKIIENLEYIITHFIEDLEWGDCRGEEIEALEMAIKLIRGMDEK